MISKRKFKYLIGIDEAGRGPLAGPVFVCAVLSLNNLKSLAVLRGVKDSKKLNPKKRDNWAKIIKKNFKYSVCSSSSSTIDKAGIVVAVGMALKKSIEHLLKKTEFSFKDCYILLDGSLKAPKIYSQETIIKGDEKISLISAASIIAKTARDKKMLILDKKLSQYGFKTHKGYGTKLHSEMIKKIGLSSEHRKTFCRKFH